MIPIVKNQPVPDMVLPPFLRDLRHVVRVVLRTGRTPPRRGSDDHAPVYPGAIASYITRTGWQHARLFFYPRRTSGAEGNRGARFSVSAAAPSRTSGPMKVSISYAADWSKIGPAILSQLFSARFVQRIAGCEPVARLSATRRASPST